MPLTPPITDWATQPLRDRVVIVTGGAQGVGRGIAQAVLGAGGSVVIADLEIIQDWIPAGSRVLDLGCGDGELLSWLRDPMAFGLSLSLHTGRVLCLGERQKAAAHGVLLPRDAP